MKKNELKFILGGEPLASYMRPKDLVGFFGQSELVGEEKILRKMIEKDLVHSMIFWGPPGSGKTTLARIISNQTGSEFFELSAVRNSKSDVMNVVDEAMRLRDIGKKSILFIDEIHRIYLNQL